MKYSQRKEGLEYLLKWFVDWGFIRDGLDSGFPWCCIVYYKVRLFSMYIWMILFNNIIPFDPNRNCKEGYSSEAAWREYTKTKEYRRKAQHIVCWFHKVLYWIQSKEHTYHRCTKCKWMQFEHKKCNRC